MRIRRYIILRIKIVGALIALSLLLILLLFIYCSRIAPTLVNTAKSYINIAVNKKIEESISQILENHKQDKFIEVTYTTEGRVSSVITNSNYINSVRTTIAKSILNELRDGTIRRINLPLGTMFGNELTYAKGPNITYNVIDNENFTSSVKGEFIESGINQTLHRMYLVFYVEVVISIPAKTEKVPIECRYLLSEIVIVGEVPDAFTDINRTFDDITESEIDDINDFGAQT